MQSLLIKQSGFLFIPFVLSLANFSLPQPNLQHSAGKVHLVHSYRKKVQGNLKKRQTCLVWAYNPTISVSKTKAKTPLAVFCRDQSWSPWTDASTSKAKAAAAHGTSCSIRLDKTLTSFRLGKPYFSPSFSLNPTLLVLPVTKENIPWDSK